MLPGLLPEGPGHLGRGGSRAGGKTQLTARPPCGLQQLIVEQPAQGTIRTAGSNQLLLQPGGLPHHQGEGGGTAGVLEMVTPEPVEIVRDLLGSHLDGGLEGELGSHGKC